VRDLTEWMIRLIETGTTGVFNAGGPFPKQATISEDGLRHPLGDDRAGRVGVGRRLRVPVRHAGRGDGAVGHATGNSRGHTRINYDRAVAHGLTFRLLAVTARDTLEWWASGAVPPERRAQPRFALAPEREAEVIAAWRAAAR
jgi:2'-hydroxyisoflavone reductase